MVGPTPQPNERPEMHGACERANISSTMHGIASGLRIELRIESHTVPRGRPLFPPVSYLYAFIITCYSDGSQ